MVDFAASGANTMTDAGHDDRRRPRALALLALLALLVLGTGLRVRHLDEPFGRSFRGVNGAAYYGQFERHFRIFGMAGVRFGLVLQSWPGTTEGMVRDFNHSPLPTMIIHAAVSATSGGIEWRLRLVPCLVSCLALLVFWRLARGSLDGPGALVALALASTGPMWAYWSVMVVAECFLPLWTALLALLLTRYLDGHLRLRWLLLVFATGCLFDWAYYFLAPAAWVAALIIRGRAFPRRLLWMLPAGIGAFLAFVAHASWAAGGLDAFIHHVRDTARTALAGEAYGPLDWLAHQGNYLLDAYTIPLWVLLLAGLLPCWPSAGGGRRLAGLVAFFVAAGVLHTTVFARHAYDHPFWTLPLAGGLYLGGGAAAARLLAARSRAARITALLLVAACIVAGTWRTLHMQDEERTEDYVARAAVVNQIAGPADVVITSEPWMQEVFYVRARTFSHIRTLPLLQELVTRYQKLRLRAPILLLLPRAGSERAPQLAAMAAWVAPHCPPPTDLGPWRLWRFTPP